jgi:hypothetical protein
LLLGLVKCTLISSASVNPSSSLSEEFNLVPAAISCALVKPSLSLSSSPSATPLPSLSVLVGLRSNNISWALVTPSLSKSPLRFRTWSLR